MGAATHTAAPGPQHYAEVALPGALIGLFAGLFAAGVAALGGLGAAMTAAIAAGMGVPLALLGALYGLVVATGRVAPGSVAPTALFWLAGFPLARLAEEVFVSTVMGFDRVLSEPLPAFLLFQALLSVGFAIGFLWLHERLGPLWLRRIRDRNPIAAALVHYYAPPAAPPAGGARRRAAERGRQGPRA